MQQHRYYLRKRKGTPFRFTFMRFPGEIRNMIYDLVVLDSNIGLVLEFTSWCPHWSKTKFKKPPRCGLWIVEEENKVRNGFRHIFRTPPVNSTRNLNLLMINKRIWREAASVLYGQHFGFCSTRALAHFLSRLRPETLGFLRCIGRTVCEYRDSFHRLDDVMNHLTHASRLEKLLIDVPPEVYENGWRVEFYNVMHNQNLILRDKTRFNIQLGRYLAFCLYHNYLGRWMMQVYRRGGYQNLFHTLSLGTNVVPMLWRYMLTGDTYLLPVPYRNADLEVVVNDDTKLHVFLGLCQELINLLSSRQELEDRQQASGIPPGRRTTRNSSKSMDLVAHASQLPDFDLRIP